MAEPPQTDVPRRSAMPTANIGVNSSQVQALLEQPSDEYLDAIEEDWNRKVDIEIETLADGMTDLVNLASIGDKDKFKIAQEAFQAQFRAESMVRAANSLLSIIHSMKLLLLISDESQIVTRRDAEFKVTQEEKEATKQKVASLLTELLQPRQDRASGSEGP
ncbi:uncharacterized protein STEHIDRAFT_165735 [Stereum hirsutum FP-91666 SS1]|uniref:uncharacterized protein n=1 Tax=Stereum hirsutum (strain FP-91666) TaxID=721885 RepID=UPI000440F333|nr:uncharacterized protein STEHIDRAFT_165735 [Stereum hirsutum FP-91666 SS1]EIM91420.1 hypothetical protein STEHIDRAFT_165735 [Stereum hirsutum FP-91666 SS1]